MFMYTFCPFLFLREAKSKKSFIHAPTQAFTKAFQEFDSEGHKVRVISHKNNKDFKNSFKPPSPPVAWTSHLLPFYETQHVVEQTAPRSRRGEAFHIYIYFFLTPTPSGIFKVLLVYRNPMALAASSRRLKSPIALLSRACRKQKWCLTTFTLVFLSVAGVYWPDAPL